MFMPVSGGGLQSLRENYKKPRISPLRYAPVEMTILFEHSIPCFQERSAELQIPRLRSG
jgi:hypothetical protein